MEHIFGLYTNPKDFTVIITVFTWESREYIKDGIETDLRLVSRWEYNNFRDLLDNGAKSFSLF